MNAAAHLMQVCDATWPAARVVQSGPWTLREGRGGGKRVSAATANTPEAAADIPGAEAAMRALGQRPLFQIRGEDAALDTALAERGYAKVDPTILRAAPIAKLIDKPVPRVTAFAIWEPLAIMAEIWRAGGIGPERLAVMARAGLKTGILGRANDKPAGVAFAGLHGETCMVHALEVLPRSRRQGVAGWMMRAAAFWAHQNGAQQMAVLVTEANRGANTLYEALGLYPVGGYHYRQSPEER